MTAAVVAKGALTLAEAADYAGVSVDTIKRAGRATDPEKYPHPLRLKRAGKASNAQLLVLRADLDDWLDRMPDA